jgi:hypothetical protein
MADVPVHRRGRLLVFVHIPKTAGTTLRAVLDMNEPVPRSRPLGNVFKGGGGRSAALIERLRVGRGPDLGGVRLVRGHFPLGVREYLPSYLPKERELHCFTFLREPIDRTLSHYYAIRKSGGGHDLPPLPAEATLEDALAGGYLDDNLQTRMLSGLPEPFGEVDDEMLAQAKHNLRDGLAFFGLTERFDESLVLAKQRLGLRSILYTANSRVNTRRPRGDEVPEELRRAAERCNRYDIELYRYAEELFDAAPERGQPDFEIELAALRAAKANGEIELDAPPPAAFDGEQAWRLLLHARASLLRLEWERAKTEVRSAAARARTRGLKRSLESLEAVPAQLKELEQEVERLEAAARARPKRDARRSKPKPARAQPKQNAKHAGSKRTGAAAKARRRGEDGG